mmetsp:Transcript_14002/g.45561  ORF Transcript_14002/g.45561 Transcript_14002/m.45561 type:complete len:203 (-) Transcript_14002:270-878(-)
MIVLSSATSGQAGGWAAARRWSSKLTATTVQAPPSSMSTILTAVLPCATCEARETSPRSAASKILLKRPCATRQTCLGHDGTPAPPAAAARGGSAPSSRSPFSARAATSSGDSPPPGRRTLVRPASHSASRASYSSRRGEPPRSSSPSSEPKFISLKLASTSRLAPGCSAATASAVEDARPSADDATRPIGTSARIAASAAA